MKEEKIILYDSPEAARLLTPEDLVKTPVWVSRPGNGKQVITTKEHIARYAGCAHQTCTETGEIFPKEWVHSRTVRIRIWRERYNKLPQLEVNENTMFAFCGSCDKTFWATRSIRITYYGAPAVQEKPE